MITEEYPDLPVFLFGISLGSSTVMMTADHAFSRNVKGIIADCGYSSMKEELTYLAGRWFHIPAFPVLSAMEVWCRVKAHFRISEADAEAALRHAQLPVLFIHGGADDFVPAVHTERNAAACASFHRTVMIEGAPHALSILKDPDLYHGEVLRFFEECR